MTARRIPPLLRLLVALAPALLLAACKTHWNLEDRETPVVVVLEAPAAARGEVSIPVLVYVGDQKAVDRLVRFPAGTTRVATPTLYVRAGETRVSVVLDGRAVASDTVKVRLPTWILVRLDGGAASISASDADPSSAR